MCGIPLNRFLTFIIDSEGLAPVGEDLVLADVPVARRAVLVGGLDAHDLSVHAALVHAAHVRRLAEHRRELVHVRHRYVDRHTGKHKNKFEKGEKNFYCALLRNSLFRLLFFCLEYSQIMLGSTFYSGFR